MIVCVLCPDQDIFVVRERAKQIEKFAKHTALTIPVSESGEPMPTHWFCTFDADQEVYRQIKDIQQISEVEECDPKSFLESRNLKVIRLRKLIAARREIRKGSRR